VVRQEWLLVRLKKNQLKLVIDALADADSTAAAEAANQLQSGDSVANRLRIRAAHVETVVSVLDGLPETPLLKATRKRLRKAIPEVPSSTGTETGDGQRLLTNTGPVAGQRKRARHFTGGNKPEH